MPSPPPDAEQQRRRRFEAVYAAYHGPVLGYVLRRTDNPDDAADVIADTFLTAWRRLEDVPPEPAARLWLYGVARRVLANHHRGQRRRSALADRLRADLAHSYQPPEYTGELAQIAQAFRRLPGAEREVLALSAWEGLDPGAAPDRLTAASGQRRWVRKGRWLIGIPVAAALAVALLVVTSLGRPGQRVGPVSVGPPAAQALSFSRHGGALTVTVRDPLADPARYRAEFARHHLHITLKLVPASPSLVGTVVYLSGDITPITAHGRCYTGGGGAACPVGVRVPASFHGQAEVVFGRAARPGEQYESNASAFAPGEVMHGMRVTGRTVAQVLAALRHRGVSVPLFNEIRRGYARHLRSVPGTWFVYDAVPWAAHQVMLFVGPARTQPNPGPPQPAGGQPEPSASPTG